MKITGIITEYNPFHYGHLYHLQKSKEITNSDAIICVLNGNFVQRGEAAMTDKWSRTKMALANGVDLVIELPVVHGIRSAEYFAFGAVQTLAATGVVSSLVFGSEIGNIKVLKQAASILLKEPKFYQNNLRKQLKKGLSFPQARENALLKFLNHNNMFSPQEKKDLEKTLSGPNNILGIEYIKCILKYNLNIKPHTIKRTHENYHKKNTGHKMASATAIRTKLKKTNQVDSIKNYVPFSTWQQINKDFKQEKIPIQREKLGSLIIHELRHNSADNLKKYAEIKNGLENRMINYAKNYGAWNDFIKHLHSKTLTKTRIKRNLLHVLLKLTKKDFNDIDQHGIKYLRVLGFNKTGEKILSHINQNSSRPIITQPAEYLKSPKTKSRDPLKKQLSYDLLATDIYSLLYKKPQLRKGGLDFTKQIIKIDD